MFGFVLLCAHTLLLFAAVNPVAGQRNVTYDGRSLIIDGQHQILFSGSIHYPRSTPEMWPSLISNSKNGGIDVIQTYVFWNLHEPKQGKFDFSGTKDIIRFVKEIQAHGLYACLRIGPFIESEWAYGGLPFWLHDVPGIIFRSNNAPFKHYMKRFVTTIVKMMKSEKLYASQGGPIILSQVENEYENVEAAFHEDGPRYVRWAAAMAVNLRTGVPWVMCKQSDAPDPVCGVTFSGPNSPNKPSMWTENWTSFYQVYGEETYMRSAEDIAFHVALFIAKNGSYVNYYMYHGGTNFGRVASAFVITSYYDQAPLDEYGLVRQPKWGHLRELHATIKACSKPLLNGTPKHFLLGKLQQAYVFEENSEVCAAFLVNYDNRRDAEVLFQNNSYTLPRKSISILPDCKNIAFNTAKVSIQYSTRSMILSQELKLPTQWKEYKEVIPRFKNTSLRAKTLLEHLNTTKDASDYLWYTFRLQHKHSKSQSMLKAVSHGHLLHVFVNGIYSGSAHGSHQNPNFILEAPISLRHGRNNIALLSAMVGLPDSGAYLEHKVFGPRKVSVQDKDFTEFAWGYQVGLLGEKLQIYSAKESNKVQWKSFGSSDHTLLWYKTHFDAPIGHDPVALNLSSMGKGEAWVNGRSIGRYWILFHTSKGNPSQSWCVLHTLNCIWCHLANAETASPPQDYHEDMYSSSFAGLSFIYEIPTVK